MPGLTFAQAFESAIAHYRAGRHAEAESLCRQILAAAPDNPDALHLLGILACTSGQLLDAAKLLARTVALAPSAPDPRQNLCIVLRDLGRFDELIPHARALVAMQPANPAPRTFLAAALTETARLDEALAEWQALHQLQPAEPAHLSNLAVTFERLGRLHEAADAARRAIALNPSYAPAHNNLAAALTKLGQPALAIESCRRAIALQPDFTDAYVNLAHAAQELGDLPAAIDAARRATQLNPNYVNAWRNLATSLDESGRTDEALAAYEHAIALLQQHDPASPLLPRLRLVSGAILPPVYDSIDDLERWRTRLAQNLSRFRDENLKLDLTHELAPTLFALPYHGRDDRAILQDYAALISAPPAPVISRQRGDKVRFAFISRFFREHTIGRLNAGLIDQLSRDRFHVTVFSVGDYSDPLASFIRSRADKSVILPPNLPAARTAIAAERPDILFYTDLGMDPVTWTLSFTRLAPLQCVTWGHPTTTANPAIDCFVSSEVMDPPGNERFYTEKLIRLPHPAVYYHRPTLPEHRKSRADFALPADATLYGCLQMLWKMHPDFDAPIAEILRRDAHGRLLLLRGLNPHWEAKLNARFARTLPDVADRILWLPRQSYADFLSLTALCDVMLDPLHFGGGNTTYEALAFNVPVITLPSPYLRGRITLALYHLMQLDDCIATSQQDYIDKALSLATDPAQRESVRQKIATRSPALFQNTQAVRDLEDALISALRSAPS